jgi:hypothetical protein
MNPAIVIVIFLCSAVLLPVLLYGTSVVRWRREPGVLVLRWFLLGVLPFGRRRVRLASIEAIQPYRFREHWRVPVEFFGRNWPPSQRLLIRVRARFIRGVVFVPESRDELLNALGRQ